MNGSNLLSPLSHPNFDDHGEVMGSRNLEDVPEEDSPLSPNSRGSRKAPSVRTLGRTNSGGESSPVLRSNSKLSSSTPGSASSSTTNLKESSVSLKSKGSSGTLRKPRSSAKLQQQQEPEPDAPSAPSTSLYWSKAPSFGAMPTRIMRAHTVTLVETTQAWLFGGCDDKECSTDVFLFDVDTLHWSRVDTIGDRPPPSRAHTTTAVDRKLVVFGGGQGSTYSDAVYVFDTVTRRWSRPMITGPRPPPRRAHTSVYYRGKIYVFGGGNGMTALNDVWTLDVTNTGRMEWQEVQTGGRKPGHRGYHTANLVGNIMIVVGGSDGRDCFNDIWCLNLDTLQWSNLPLDTAHRRLSHTSTQIGSYLFIIGGHDGSQYRRDLLLFNLVTLAYEPGTALGRAPGPRGYHVSLVSDSRLFLFGGFSGSAPFDEVYILDLAAAAYLPQVTQFDILLPD
ncbi:unnamed protein product [Mycena citricolor]|uniref:Galactose oxidase n=1 Tax=Mycena citricolor TaxID=2018698 RepID=A0AAD2JZX4_9AGAR|nr:unnamed protein product [Mycena citricolor]